MPQDSRAEAPDEDVLDEQINVAMPAEMKATLKKMKRDTGIQPAEMGRKLFEAAIEFWQRHGTLTFPVAIYPKPTQAAYISEIKEWLALDHYPTPEERALSAVAEPKNPVAERPPAAQKSGNDAPSGDPTRATAQGSSTRARRGKR